MVRWLVRADHLALPPLPQPEARGAAVRDLAPRHQLPLLPQDGYVRAPYPYLYPSPQVQVQGDVMSCLNYSMLDRMV